MSFAHIGSGTFPNADGAPFEARFVRVEHREPDGLGAYLLVMDTDFRLVHARSVGCASAPMCEGHDGWFWLKVPSPWLHGASLLFGATVFADRVLPEMVGAWPPLKSLETLMTDEGLQISSTCSGQTVAFATGACGSVTLGPQPGPPVRLDTGEVLRKASADVDLAMAAAHAHASWAPVPRSPDTRTVPPETDETHLRLGLNEAVGMAPTWIRGEIAALKYAGYEEREDSVAPDVTGWEAVWSLDFLLKNGTWATFVLECRGGPPVLLHGQCDDQVRASSKLAERGLEARFVPLDEFTAWTADLTGRADRGWARLEIERLSRHTEPVLVYSAVYAYGPDGSADSFVSMDATKGTPYFVKGDESFLEKAGLWLPLRPTA